MVLEEHGTYRSFKAGETIFEVGEEGHHMYVVDNGRVEIVAGWGDREVALAVLGPEEIFGEMALFGEHPRSATARALTDVGVRVIDEQDIHKMVGDPLAVRLVMDLGQRLREVDRRLEALSEHAVLTREEILDLRGSLGQLG